VAESKLQANSAAVRSSIVSRTHMRSLSLANLDPWMRRVGCSGFVSFGVLSVLSVFAFVFVFVFVFASVMMVSDSVIMSSSVVLLRAIVVFVNPLVVLLVLVVVLFTSLMLSSPESIVVVDVDVAAAAEEDVCKETDDASIPFDQIR